MSLILSPLPPPGFLQETELNCLGRHGGMARIEGVTWWPGMVFLSHKKGRRRAILGSMQKAGQISCGGVGVWQMGMAENRRNGPATHNSGG